MRTRRSARSAARRRPPYSAGTPRAAGSRRPRARIEVRAPSSGPPLTTTSRSGVKTSVETSRAQLLRGSEQPRPFSRAFFASPGLSVTSISSRNPPRRRAARSARVCAEADELRVVRRPRREALRPDVERLEQVRLAGAVRPDRQHEPGASSSSRTRTSGSRGA
jgi:hypothetical protein